MNIIRLYKNGCTLKNRCANYQALRYVLNVSNTLLMRVDGCIITGTTGYVDITSSLSYAEICRYGFMSIAQETEEASETLLVFIDEIQQNNFSEDTNYYRIIFSIDWWDTLIYRGLDISNYIEGDVVRAHVNDIKKDDSLGMVAYKPDMSYTMLEPEEDVNNISKVEYNIFDNNRPKGFRFLYILTTKKATENSSTSTPIIKVGEKEIRCGLNLCVLVLPPLGYSRQYVWVKYITPTDESPYFNITNAFINSPDDLTDSSVVGMFVSDYCPFFNYDENDVDKTYQFIIPFNSGPTYSNAYQVTPLDGRYGKYNAITFHDATFPSFEVTASRYNIKRMDTQIGITQEDTYETYLKNGVTKIHFYPYTYTYVAKGDSKIAINTAYSNNNLFEINMDGYGTSYILYLNSVLLNEESKYIVVQDTGLSGITATLDTITKLNSFASGMSAFNNLALAIGGAIINPNIGSVGSVAGQVSSGIQTGAQIYKTLRDGENGTRATPAIVSNYTDTVRLCVTTPIENEKHIIIEHLAKYGYNTFLHPHEILTNHKRKYFNYIKTINCVITYNKMPENIRKDIENMFDSGVWLWQSTDFGDYEVANYPQITEE